ncbi:MAG: M48 family metalloprotease [Mycobacterium leprae]
MLIGALLSAGMFMGTWLHNASPVGDDWRRQVAACLARNPLPQPGTSLAPNQRFLRCTAGVERRRAAFAAGGLVVAALGGLGLMIATPHLVERRRRLHPAVAGLAPAVARFEALVRDEGLRRPPVLVVGPSTLRDAFSYGTPGRYRVALPPAVAVRWRDEATFDPLVRHELAHVARHDVAFAWMARSVWIVVVPLLVLPLVVAPLVGDLSILPSYGWRAALLAGVALLASAALLRSREYDADLRSARSEERIANLQGLLKRVPAPTRTGWRRLVAYHPSAVGRCAVLGDPARHAGVTFVDGLTVAFLAALILPLLESLMYTAGRADLSFALPAAVLGPVLGATVGLGLWRQALVSRIAGTRSHVASAALGVLVGYGLGETASLAQTGLRSPTGYSHAALGIVIAIGMCGATIVAAGLGDLFADASARFRTARAASLTCLFLVGALFAVVLWAATNLSNAFDWGGWTLANMFLLTTLSARPAAAVALVLAAASAWALRAVGTNGTAPRWAIDGDAPGTWPMPGKPRVLGTLACGVGAGVIGALVIVGFRLVMGPAQGLREQEQRFYLYVWLFAAVGAATGFALVAVLPDRGLGLALLASPVASVTAAMGFVALNTASGGSITLSFLEFVARPGVTLGFLILVVVAVVSLTPRPLWATATGTLVAVVLCVVFASVASLMVVAGRYALVPVFTAVVGGGTNPQQGSGGATNGGGTGRAEAEAYATAYAPGVSQRMGTVEQSVRLIDGATSLTGTERGMRVRTECLAPVQALLANAQTLQPSTDVVRVVHERLITALRLSARSFEHFAFAYEHGDPALLAQAQTERMEGRLTWQAWKQLVGQLAGVSEDAARRQ